jgi:excisionase family DNA binding protein
MNQMMVSAGEAARRLGVAPATIQRWVDDGLLHAERTPGGHRRIYVTELRRLIAANRSAEIAGPLADWLDILLSGNAARVKATLVASRQKTGNWADTADEVVAAIAEIGRSWEAGACHVFEEHAATEALRRATASCIAEMPCADDGPRAVLITVEEERHTLGLSLAELVLGEAGWRPIFIGEGPPAAELKSVVTKFNPKLLVVSASEASPASAVVHYETALVEAVANTGVQLVLGGGGAWTASSGAARVVTFKELREALSRRRL